MRTRVFLVLVAIAIGGAGAGIYLAIDAQDNAVTKSDLQTVATNWPARPHRPKRTQASELEAELRNAAGGSRRAAGQAPQGRERRRRSCQRRPPKK